MLRPCSVTFDQDEVRVQKRVEISSTLTTPASAVSKADRPVLDVEFAHREISWVTGCEPAAERERRRRDETVRLRQRAAASGELAPPLSRLPAFGGSKRRDSKAGKERASLPVLARPQPSNRLLDVDRTRVWRVPRIAERQEPPARVRATAEEVDQDGRVEKDRRQLPDAALISVPLVANPRAGIVVPFVTAVRDCAERRLEQLPAVIVVQRTLDRARDVRAPATSTHPSIKVPDDVVAKSYVQTHGHTLTHSLDVGLRDRSELLLEHVARQVPVRGEELAVGDAADARPAEVAPQATVYVPAPWASRSVAGVSIVTVVGSRELQPPP